ncbi:MAG: hypothetical protein AB8B91_14895 [Rubripirellula sp.]
MILLFPNIDVLQLAMTSRVVSEEIQCAPAKVAHLDEAILIDTPEKISRTVAAELKKLGVESKRSVKLKFQKLVSWHQALPLGKVEEGELSDKTEILFEIDGEEHLPEIVGEMLRLGNDRQSFRYVGQNGTAKTLLRVTAPPYYTMLRAIDRTDASPQINAFIEQSARVWVPVGYTHPMGSRLNPPAGKWLLITADNQWRFLQEGAFRDVYDVLEFQLPDSPTDFQDQEPTERIRVPLQLTDGGNEESAELWVLTGNAMQQVENLVRRSDNDLIHRLAFAVAGTSGDAADPTVIIRVRPSKKSPPVLVLDGVQHRTYLKIPNLFLPVGQRLHPPLRRDAVNKLLASESDKICWLMPQPQSEHDQDRLIQHRDFTPQSIDDSAFRPLSDWIHYVIDHEAEPLKKWVASHQFDFESFVCADDGPKKKPGPPKKRPVGASKQETESKGTPKSFSGNKAAKGTKMSGAEDVTQLEFKPAKQKNEPDELQVQLRELEEQFQTSDEPLDGPSRSQMWQNMGMANAALMHRHDSTICWSNSFWNETSPNNESLKDWLRCEQHCSSVGKLTPDTLDEVMADRKARSSEPGLVAAYLHWAVHQEQTPPELLERQTELTQFLQRQENHLPIRAAWLSWCAMYRMSGDDVLLLARARDRLLERLFKQGLAPEFDMVAFMRTGTGGSTDRFRVLRDQLLQLREKVGTWIVEPTLQGNPETKQYADLIFAFALARVNETQRCDEVLTPAAHKLGQADALHQWVLQAFDARIKQALVGQTVEEQLPDELLSQLETMDRMDRYKIDRLRQQSRILEPHVRIDPFRNWHQRYADDLGRDLAMLQNVVDREQLNDKIVQLMNQHGGKREAVRILPAVLPLAPRVSEKFAVRILEYVPAALDLCREPMEKALVLQRSLHVAAHYGRVDMVQGFVNALMEALPEIVSNYLSIETQTTPENKERSDAIESLFTQSFRGLRKLGMREQIGRLYGSVAEQVETATGSKKSRVAKRKSTEGSRAQRLLLCVAGGWYYFGEEDRAREIADGVRTRLKAGDLPAIEQRTLATAYLNAVSQAPAEEALERVNQIFAIGKKGARDVPNISDSMATSSHFSISQLDVVETAILSLISDDFSLNAEARRWLDEDEFLVRSRIHRDVRQATGT